MKPSTPSGTLGMTTVAVHPSSEMYGSDRMFLESVAAIQEPVLAVLPDEGPLARALTARGVKVELLDFPVLRRVELSSPVAALGFALRFAIAVPRLAWWIRRRQIKDVYVSTVIAPVWIYAARLAGRRVQCHVHESEPGMPRAVSRVLLRPLRKVDRIIANSHHTADWIKASTGIETSARCRVVYNGVEERHSIAPTPLWQVSAKKKLVVVGRLSVRKGQDVAIRATALLREKGYDVGLTIVGDCFPGYDYVERDWRRIVVDLKLESHVSFEGFRDPFGFVSGADVVLVPSRVEPFGLVAVEALMLGRPTVASRVGGLPEIIEDEISGRLVVPDNPGALADAIGDLLDDPDAAAALGRAGRCKARQRFSVAGYVQRLREALSPEGLAAP